MRPDLAVVVVTFNSAHVIGDLLDSLESGLGGLSADVVVVDNGSSDNTAALLEKRSDCRLVRSSNVGFAAGINRGVRTAHPAEAILVLNPDVILFQDCVPRMLEVLSQPGVGVVAPQIRTPAGDLYHSLRREPTLPRAMGLTRTGLAALSEYVSEPRDYLHPRVVDWALGAVLAMSRACFDALDGWDETYFLYSEETDFCLRAQAQGYATRYQPEALAVHIGGQSGQSEQTHVMQIVNRVRLYRRRHSAIASWAYYWLTVASEISWVIRGRPRSRAAVAALLRPSLRPLQLGCADRLLPT